VSLEIEATTADDRSSRPGKKKNLKIETVKYWILLGLFAVAP
jgi:hypothetical protein